MTAVVPTIAGGVTSARGFRAAGIAAGIKASQALDLALVVSDTTARAASVFTTNRAVAAPVVVSREHLTRSAGAARAIVVNSGCANACTGSEGLQAARDMAEGTAQLVGCPVEQVLVASTGVIGVALPMDKVRAGLPVAARSLGADQGSAAARAIMTTDPFPKEAAAKLSVGAGRAEITIGGMAKGSGMIEPMLATMLGFVTTDADVPQALLDRALREAVDDTFNAITVDGECSTNDCVMILANGASGVTIDETTYSTFVERAHRRLPRAGARHRARRRRRNQARHGRRHRRRVVCGRASRGQSDCELPARENRHSRRRSELGTSDRGRRASGRRVRARARRGR